MLWFLNKLSELGADPLKLTTHDAVHGVGAKWQKDRYEEHGFGYDAPTTPACIRAITQPGATSLYYFVTQVHASRLPAMQARSRPRGSVPHQ